MVDDRPTERTGATSGVTVTLNHTNVYTRWPCLCCGGHTEKDSVLADVLEDGKWTEYVVCPWCLADPDLAGTIRKHAVRCRAQAESLEEIARNLPALPSLGDWGAAQVEADVKFLVEAEGWSHESALADIGARDYTVPYKGPRP